MWMITRGLRYRQNLNDMFYQTQINDKKPRLKTWSNKVFYLIRLTTSWGHRRSYMIQMRPIIRMTVFIFPAHIWITQFSTRFNSMHQIKSTGKVLGMPLFKSRMAILWIPTLILLNQGRKRRFIQQELWQRCNLCKTHRRSSTDPLRLKGQFLKTKEITWTQPLFEIGKLDPVNSIKLSNIIKISSTPKATGLILQINIKYQMTLNSWQELGWGLNHSSKE